jgi:hypothetical protein
MESVGAILSSSLVAWLVAALFVYVAARMVARKKSFIAAFASVFVGSLLAGLVQIGAGKAGAPAWASTVLGFTAVALVIAIFYRTKWLHGAIIGFVAALLWAGVQWLMQRFL